MRDFFCSGAEIGHHNFARLIEEPGKSSDFLKVICILLFFVVRFYTLTTKWTR